MGSQRELTDSAHISLASCKLEKLCMKTFLASTVREMWSVQEICGSKKKKKGLVGIPRAQCLVLREIRQEQINKY